MFTASIVEGGYKEEQLDGDGGPFIRTTIKASLPFHSNDIHATLNLMKYDRWILIVCLRDQPARLIGDLESGATMTHLYDAGAVRSKTGSGTDIEFRYNSEDKPPLYQLPAQSAAPWVVPVGPPVINPNGPNSSI